MAAAWLLSDAGFRFPFPNPALFLDFEDDVDSARDGAISAWSGKLLLLSLSLSSVDGW